MTDITWSHRSTRDCEIAKFTVGNLTATVQDLDGDCSVWQIKDGDVVIAKCEEWIYSPSKESGLPYKYHFDMAKEQAEAALTVEAEKRGLYTR